ncbi:hypothetical protein E2562_001305 [Oryza meyeriana var. granulata]|uniref:Uncharacterized protein n=1 Tax=Oryza meyeriana var. granulata TaxID=110450 RepID=A0A6G1DCG6_9ORYZ|nr:hypothetical protein E2562_001305 [Oryza meyeriana var. granulata]
MRHCSKHGEQLLGGREKEDYSSADTIILLLFQAFNSRSWNASPLMDVVPKLGGSSGRCVDIIEAVVICPMLICQAAAFPTADGEASKTMPKGELLLQQQLKFKILTKKYSESQKCSANFKPN